MNYRRIRINIEFDNGVVEWKHDLDRYPVSSLAPYTPEELKEKWMALFEAAKAVNEVDKKVDGLRVTC